MPQKRKAKSQTAALPAVDWESMKVVDLVKECQKRGLSASGKKIALVAALLASEGAAGTKKLKTEQKTKAELEKMKVVELRAECKKRGLEERGTKAQLIAKLQGGSDGDEDEEKDDKTKVKEAMQEMAKSGGKKVYKLDGHLPPHLRNAGTHRVYEDYDCMLNQTNIGHNNNKYYVIQIVQPKNGRNLFYVWNRWGRVGEPGQNALRHYSNVDDAIADFCKKFNDKTRNSWTDRHKFEPHPGKYTMIDVGGEVEEEEVGGSSTVKSSPQKFSGVETSACKLDPETQKLIKLIFDHDMFSSAMQEMDIDIKKMPLGQLSKVQIAKGYEVLEDIESILDKKSKGNLQELSSKFYTLIPHNFGRQRPPVINSKDILQAKMDMLITLGDIELAQSLQKTIKKEEKQHPLDVNYQLLQCDLEYIPNTEKEYKVIENYVACTSRSWSGGTKQILGVWRVDRSGESKRFGQHKSIDNRRLLWHGTNVAVVAAILKSGLRIMPHSGGRVGKGIYFASEQAKSAGYVRAVSRNGVRTGIMFLNEVILGAEHTTLTGGGFTSAPKGYDSIVARGSQEPDPKKDMIMTFDGKKVAIPQGKPVKTQYKSSHFDQSEYLVYKESQNKIRYLIMFKF